MKDNPRQQFRWAPHVSGAANVKPKDYEQSGEVEAENEYAAWAVMRNAVMRNAVMRNAVMRNAETPLQVGDLLEFPEGQLRICKYVGFEEARWIMPDPVNAPLTVPLTLSDAAIRIPQNEPQQQAQL